MRKEENRCNSCKYSNQARNDICLTCNRYGVPRSDMWQPADRGRHGINPIETQESNEMMVIKDLIAKVSDYHAIGVQVEVLVRKAGEIGIPEYRARHLIEKLLSDGHVAIPIDGFLKPTYHHALGP